MQTTVNVGEQIPKGLYVHTYVSFTNTIITISNDEGRTLYVTSAGCAGFKKARRASPFAALQVGEKAGKWIVENKPMEDVHVVFKGLGPSRPSVLKGLSIASCNVKNIFEATQAPHNGCCPPKRRRV